MMRWDLWIVMAYPSPDTVDSIISNIDQFTIDLHDSVGTTFGLSYTSVISPKSQFEYRHHNHCESPYIWSPSLSFVPLLVIHGIQSMNGSL